MPAPKKRKKQTKKKKSTTPAIKKNVRLKSVNPKYAPKVRKDLLDADYLDTLDEETFKWYAQFTDEWSAGAIKKDSMGRITRGHIHRTNALAKELYDANNKRNNDIYGVSKANGLVQNLDMVVGENNETIENKLINNVNLTELAINESIDNKVQDENELLTKREFLKMVKNGAKIPQEMFDFYKKYYNLEL